MCIINGCVCFYKHKFLLIVRFHTRVGNILNTVPPRRNLYIAIYIPTFLMEKSCKTVHEVCSKCKACQFIKRNKKQYGKLPSKEAESKPWDVLCVDLIGQYQFTLKGGGKKYEMTTKKGKTMYLQAVTMIDPATGWIEICMVPSAHVTMYLI